MKTDFLVTFRSVTYAQTGERVLRRAGFSCALRRTPGELNRRGCGYCLTVRERDIRAAVELLRAQEVSFGKVYVRLPGGAMEEWAL